VGGRGVALQNAGCVMSGWLWVGVSNDMLQLQGTSVLRCSAQWCLLGSPHRPFVVEESLLYLLPVPLSCRRPVPPPAAAAAARRRVQGLRQPRLCGRRQAGPLPAAVCQGPGPRLPKRPSDPGRDDRQAQGGLWVGVGG
jgi:hypothetical protein